MNIVIHTLGDVRLVPGVICDDFVFVCCSTRRRDFIVTSFCRIVRHHHFSIDTAGYHHSPLPRSQSHAHLMKNVLGLMLYIKPTTASVRGRAVSSSTVSLSCDDVTYIL